MILVKIFNCYLMVLREKIFKMKANLFILFFFKKDNVYSNCNLKNEILLKSNKSFEIILVLLKDIMYIE